MTVHHPFQRATLDAPSGAALNLYRCTPSAARAVLVIFHGLAEHAARYERVAGFLAARNIAVYAHDHRGHGSTVARDAPLRRFARRDGAEKVIADCQAVVAHATARHPGLPILVLGHSMGGLIALNHAERHGAALSGLMVWNSDFRSGWQLKAGRLGLKVEKALKGSDVASELFRRAMFDTWARAVPRRRTAFDWLSHDRHMVDAYVADPLCGFTPTVSMMEDLTTLIGQGARQEELARLPASLPIHLLGGSEDPVTARGAAMRWLAKRLRDRGMADVTLVVVDGARHETLNEAEPMRGTALSSLLAFVDRIAADRP